ncbi:sulfotransferase [Algiphilus sp.]|uniref:sulfotransferase family protein n=1 Tax=Algiphilus sp. TaxID=1872431 RepID=UPI0032F09C73
MPEQSRFEFLILGPGRGGTSLLAALLDYHPDLHVVFEHHVTSTLLAHDRFEAASERADAFLRACEEAASAAAKPVWANKITTEQVARLEPSYGESFPRATESALDVFFNGVLANKKVIFILRDGRTCVRSKMRRARHSVEEACARWLYAYDVWRFLNRRAQSLSIRFEDLVRAPEQTLTEVCAFLETRFDPVMLSGTTHKLLNPDYRNSRFMEHKATYDDTPVGIEERLRKELELSGYLVP